MADTDEAIREARRQGYEEGRKAERDAIVAAIRRFAEGYDGRGLTGTARKNVEMLADLFESGAHVGAAKRRVV